MQSSRLLPLVLCSLALSAATSFADEALVPLQIELPKPLFVGTPRPIQLANLEKFSNAKRPDPMVPAGTVLLSGGKPVTSSDSMPIIGELGFVTDGDKSGVEGSYVELGPELQWVQIDLEKPAKLAAIVLWHFHSQARVYHKTIVQVSDDPEFKKDVKTLYNNDAENAAGLGAGTDLAYIESYQGRLIEAKGVTGRYVRLYSSGNTSNELNHYCEVEVYGQPAK